MSVIAAIFVGGGIGSVLRHLLSSQIGSHWGIMLVNVLGAMLIGMAYAYFADRASLRPETRAFIITGLLGGFTTFSTYMLDFNLLLAGIRNVNGIRSSCISRSIASMRLLIYPLWRSATSVETPTI